MVEFQTLHALIHPRLISPTGRQVPVCRHPLPSQCADLVRAAQNSDFDPSNHVHKATTKMWCPPMETIASLAALRKPKA